jgi:hypothetical protein
MAVKLTILFLWLVTPCGLVGIINESTRCHNPERVSSCASLHKTQVSVRNNALQNGACERNKIIFTVIYVFMCKDYCPIFRLKVADIRGYKSYIQRN